MSRQKWEKGIRKNAHILQLVFKKNVNRQNAWYEKCQRFTFLHAPPPTNIFEAWNSSQNLNIPQDFLFLRVSIRLLKYSKEVGEYFEEKMNFNFILGEDTICIEDIQFAGMYQSSTCFWFSSSEFTGVAARRANFGAD